MSNKQKLSNKDPFAKRESQKYENPIPSREYILQYLENKSVPLSKEQLSEDLNINNEEQQEALRRRLNAMVRDGQILCNRSGYYGLVTKMGLIKGRISGHIDGHGYIKSDKIDEPLFVSNGQMRELFHGDTVLAHFKGFDRKGRRECEIVEVLEHSITTVIGQYFQEGLAGVVVPDNKKIQHTILIPPEEGPKPKSGQIVSAEITHYPTRRTQALGKIVDVLGDAMTSGMEIDIAIRRYELPNKWSDEIATEVEKLPVQVRGTDKESRKDLTHLPFVTIDGEDAKDFDDAVYCEMGKRQTWKLWVAIADVSYYIKPGSALDKSAYTRGTSVYFPSKVVPMLPEALSNELCSLKPDVERLTMVCEMSVGQQGKVGHYEFYPAVIRSRARMTYTDVANLLSATPKDTLKRKYKPLLKQFNALHGLYEALAEARRQRGAIDFDSSEVQFIFNQSKKIERIVPCERNIAHRIIEECMLAANVAAARLLRKQKITALFRNHDDPDPLKIVELRQFLAESGLSLTGGAKPKTIDFAQLLAKTKDRKDTHVIQEIMLRSMKQACYASKPQGHFGLAYPSYTHFTSPIRRYPDLVVHRALWHLYLYGSSQGFIYDEAQMEKIAEHSSVTERRADEATRDVTNWLQCEYMSHHLGGEFHGVVSGVTSFGLFVKLSDLLVEGLIHISSLDQDYFHFDSVHHRLIGERTKKSYHLGDPLHIRVVRVDMDKRQIDFTLVSSKSSPKRKSRPKRSRSKSRKRS